MPSIVNNKLPAVNNKLPVVNNKLPVVNNKLPVVNNKLPVVNNKLPVVNGISSINKSTCSRIKKSSIAKDRYNIIQCIINHDHLRLELYLVIYNDITGIDIVDEDIMNFAVLRGNVNILRILHNYSNSVFDVNILKNKHIDCDIITFLLNNYGGIKPYLIKTKNK